MKRPTIWCVQIEHPTHIMTEDNSLPMAISKLAIEIINSPDHLEFFR